MYKCEDCSREFDEPRFVKEIHYELPEHPYETFMVCPFCACTVRERTDTDEEELFPLWKRIFYNQCN